MTPLLKISDLAREPEFHLAELLEVLRRTEDGYDTRRISDAMFEADAGNGYDVTIYHEYQCGFDEDGDGKVLTMICGRLAESGGLLTLTLAQVERPEHYDHVNDVQYWTPRWRVSVQLPATYAILGPMNGDPSPRAGQTGQAEGDRPGTAALVAYLRAWGTVE